MWLFFGVVGGWGDWGGVVGGGGGGGGGGEEGLNRFGLRFKV